MDKYSELALVFKALSDPNRLLILEYLKEGERCACVILERLQITQSTLSYHMKLLSDSSIINARKEGKWMYYSLNRERIREINQYASEFIS